MDNGYFELGTASQYVQLWLLFLVATFTIIIHLMNMLIAIMGQTFSTNS